MKALDGKVIESIVDLSSVRNNLAVGLQRAAEQLLYKNFGNIANVSNIDLVPTGTFDDLYLHIAQRCVAASGPIWDYGPMFETVAL